MPEEAAPTMSASTGEALAKLGHWWYRGQIAGLIGFSIFMIFIIILAVYDKKNPGHKPEHMGASPSPRERSLIANRTRQQHDAQRLPWLTRTHCVFDRCCGK
jgi:hypothetical protein